MQKIIISDEAYNEFKSFLHENKVDNYCIRIILSGGSCHGPVFGISVSDARENDIIEKVNDITFIIQEELFKEYGIFTVLSTEENEGLGLTVRPLIEPEGGCSTCAGCH